MVITALTYFYYWKSLIVIDEHLTAREVQKLISSKEEDSNVLRRTSEISEDEVIIATWVPEQTHEILYEVAKSKKMSVEKLCSEILQEASKCQ